MSHLSGLSLSVLSLEEDKNLHIWYWFSNFLYLTKCETHAVTHYCTLEYIYGNKHFFFRSWWNGPCLRTLIAFQRTRFDTYHPHDSSQPSLTPVPRDMKPSSGLSMCQVSYTDVYESKTTIDIKLNWIKKISRHLFLNN